MSLHEESARRPIAARSSVWAKSLSAKLGRWGVSPNAISVTSVIFAAIGGLLIFFGTYWLAWLRSFRIFPARRNRPAKRVQPVRIAATVHAATTRDNLRT